MMRKVALCTEYCGTHYAGWQRQKNAYAVQEALEDALETLLDQKISLIACSRTDAGVHALAHISHFNLDHTIPTEAIPRALIPYLPDDISVLDAVDVPESFNARYDPVSKIYQYHILNRSVPSALYYDRITHVPGKLNVKAMQAACQVFLGKHDFKALQAAQAQVKTTTRTLYRLELKDLGGGHLMMEVEGDGFLYNMVRILAGTLVFVGQGKIMPESLPQRLKSLDRRQMGKTMPAHGLYLVKVNYDPDPFKTK